MKSLINKLLGGCRHKKTSWPQTRRNANTGRPETYICCLECGKEILYSFEEMRIIKKCHPTAG